MTQMAQSTGPEILHNSPQHIETPLSYTLSFSFFLHLCLFIYTSFPFSLTMLTLYPLSVSLHFSISLLNPFYLLPFSTLYPSLLFNAITLTSITVWYLLYLSLSLFHSVPLSIYFPLSPFLNTMPLTAITVYCPTVFIVSTTCKGTRRWQDGKLEPILLLFFPLCLTQTLMTFHL